MATLAGTVTLFFGGWIIFGMILMDFMASNAGSATGVMRSETEMVWWSLILGSVMQAYFIVYVFHKMNNITSFGDGLKTAAIFGLLISMAFDFTMYGTSNIMSLTGVVVDILANTVLWGLAGGVIGMVVGKK